MTMTRAVRDMRRTRIVLNDHVRRALVAALATIGYDASDCNGISLMGVTDLESAHLRNSTGGDTDIGAIIAASEQDGTRIAIVGDELVLLADAAELGAMHEAVIDQMVGPAIDTAIRLNSMMETERG